jgi:hypothetical protein
MELGRFNFRESLGAFLHPNEREWQPVILLSS